MNDPQNALQGFLSNKLTVRDTLLAMVAGLPADHPERRFVEWFDANRKRIRPACAELGVEPPVEGPDLFKRLKAVVMPALEKQQQEAL